MPKVSIVIPTFNRAESLKKTLNSILAQTYRDYEVIIVANGSTDNTQEVVTEFKDPRLKYVFQDGSGSPASPRNTGIKITVGRFIAFCDDDDLWLPEKLAKQVRFLQDNKQYNICYTRMKRFNKQTEWINPDEGSEDSANSRSLLYKNTIPLSSVILRKEVFENNESFDEAKSIAGSEDYECFLRLSKNNKLFCIQEYLTLYSSEDGRFSASGSNNALVTNFAYISRLCHVYIAVVRKDYFKWYNVIVPFLANFFLIVKIIAYELLVLVKKKFTLGETA